MLTSPIASSSKTKIDLLSSSALQPLPSSSLSSLGASHQKPATLPPAPVVSSHDGKIEDEADADDDEGEGEDEEFDDVEEGEGEDGIPGEGAGEGEGEGAGSDSEEDEEEEEEDDEDSDDAGSEDLGGGSPVC